MTNKQVIAVLIAPLAVAVLYLIFAASRPNIKPAQEAREAKTVEPYRTVTHAGHTYLCFDVGFDRFMTHDPDCKCGK